MLEPGKTYNTAVEVTLEVIGGKWKPVILFHLTFGTKRNGELMSLMPTVTQKVLTQQLRELEEDGVVTRISYNQVPPKVEYELTEYGWSLKELLHIMCRWGDRHVERVYGDKVKIVESSPRLNGI
ncbi:DNA-binding HxlR family transcriptional regulator [Paenibacillus sp. V4I3]|uniref:winged helix-turn-helix transcriptional regulator n=1 Tax=Paenibacillus sp. V4I3 TaxID=3042305 RepID=UPI0027832CFE|nr:helix-turn-helix domain-containing protein [Paenibacillus sp. V4I3]MDQ0876209.1 DNA-binding HxlR family transcriptional regulator [Paenibacillus sp. V4I3]